MSCEPGTGLNYSVLPLRLAAQLAANAARFVSASAPAGWHVFDTLSFSFSLSLSLSLSLNISLCVSSSVFLCNQIIFDDRSGPTTGLAM